MSSRAVVLVSWVDPCSPDGGWQDAEDFALELAHCETAGFLWSDDGEVVVVVGSYNDCGQLDHATVIPKGSVRSMVTLAAAGAE